MTREMFITIPPAFASGVIGKWGQTGRKWLDDLPAQFEAVCKEWGLKADGEPSHGYLGLVLPVLRGHEPCVLKITWPDENARLEILGLQTWNGQGAVKLLKAEPEKGVLLLERLNSKKSLDQLDIRESTVVIADLLRRLSVPAPQGVPNIREVAPKTAATLAHRWEKLGRPFSEKFVESAQAAVRELAPGSGDFLVNHDLHYGNVLAGEREPWLVIDPKVTAGDPEYSVFSTLMHDPKVIKDTQAVEFVFDRITDTAKLDGERARGWAMFRVVDYWLWALGIGYTEDPAQCALIAEYLTGKEF